MKNKLFLFLPLLMLSSCGTEISKTVPSTIDGSTNWNSNYYTRWDESLRSIETTKVELDDDKNKVINKFKDQHYLELETNHDLAYTDFNPEIGFGNHRKLSLYNDLVKDGFVSKLFDGQLFCNGYYEKARVQIKEEGFSSSFYKPLKSADYLFLNFKAALDFKQNDPDSHTSDITIHISLYGDKNVTYSYRIPNMPTNFGEGYKFFGFSLKDQDISGVKDFAITYTLHEDSYNKEKGTSIAHSLLLYEFGFGNPTF